MAPCPQMPKWLKNILESSYCTFLVSLFGTLLSFADPITDILALVEFYREDHKTWFAVGLSFVLLPCVAFLILSAWNLGLTPETCFCGLHPFSSAWFRLKICWKKLKICCRYDYSNSLYLLFYLDCGISYHTYILLSNSIGSDISLTKARLCGVDPFSSAWFSRLKICWTDSFKKCCGVDTDYKELQHHSEAARMVEAVLESAPQFIIQLHAMSVQQEPVKIIQMISLPVSFISLVWASTTADEYIHVTTRKTITRDLNVKHKVFLVATHLFLLSSRLFAIAFFTIVCKWWIIIVLLIHSVLILIVDASWVYNEPKKKSGEIQLYWKKTGMLSAVSFCLLWLRDDVGPIQHTRFREEVGRQKFKTIQPFSNLLFVIENCTMILIFYFISPFSNTWYSLPVTVCVCSFSVIGAAARVAHFRFLFKEKNNDADGSTQQKDNNLSVSTETVVVCLPPSRRNTDPSESTKGFSRSYTM